MDSDADATSDISVSVSATPIYKRYTDAQLADAIKAVVDEGMKQVDACIKYGIPFTTLTRKLSIYRAGGSCLLSMTTKKKKRSPSSKVCHWPRSVIFCTRHIFLFAISFDRCQ